MGPPTLSFRGWWFVALIKFDRTLNVLFEMGTATNPPREEMAFKLINNEKCAIPKSNVLIMLC